MASLAQFINPDYLDVPDDAPDDDPNVLRLVTEPPRRDPERARIERFMDRARENKDFAELAELPIDALQGVSKEDAEAIKRAFNVRTIRDIAESKLVRAAQAITMLADLELRTRHAPVAGEPFPALAPEHEREDVVEYVDGAAEETVILDPRRMTTGLGYPFRFLDHTFLVIKQPDESLDVFFVREAPEDDAPEAAWTPAS